MERVKLSVVIPCYNEEEVLRIAYTALRETVDLLIQDKYIFDYEIIFINDGSQDQTDEILCGIAQQDAKVKIVMFNSNFGHQSAMLAGILNSSGDAIISMDADLQDPPKYFRDFLEEYYKGNDVVIGIRNNREIDPIFKRFFAHSFYYLAKLLGVPGEFDAGDYRLISKRVLLNIREYHEGNLYLRGLIPSMRFKTGKVYYKREERYAGSTKYPFLKSLDLALNGITSFSIRPLRLIGILGILLFCFSLLLIIWLLYLKIFTGAPIVGWTSTITLIAIFQGLNFMFIAIVGEYLGKTYMETKGRPLFVIKEKINFDN